MGVPGGAAGHIHSPERHVSRSWVAAAWHLCKLIPNSAFIKDLVALLAATLADMSHARGEWIPCSALKYLRLQTSECRFLLSCLQGLHANLSTSTALQIGARPFDEATLFEIGYAYEQLVRPRAVNHILTAPQFGP